MFYRSTQICRFRLRWLLRRSLSWRFLLFFFYWDLVSARGLLIGSHSSCWTVVGTTWRQRQQVTLRGSITCFLNISALKLVGQRIVANSCDHYLALLRARLLIWLNRIHLEESHPCILEFASTLHVSFNVIVFLDYFRVRSLPGVVEGLLLTTSRPRGSFRLFLLPV